MYRTRARRLKNASTWTLSVAVAVGAGVLMTQLFSTPTTRATSATPSTVAVTSSSSAPASATATGATGATPSASSVRTASLGVSLSPRTIVAVGSHSISVQGVHGITTYQLDSATVVLLGRTRVAASSLHVGEKVIVVPSATDPRVAASVGIVASATSEGDSEGGSDD